MSVMWTGGAAFTGGNFPGVLALSEGGNLGKINAPPSGPLQLTWVRVSSADSFPKGRDQTAFPSFPSFHLSLTK